MRTSNGYYATTINKCLSGYGATKIDQPTPLKDAQLFQQQQQQ